MGSAVVNAEWVPASVDGGRWVRRIRNGRTLGGIVFYRARGSERACFWRAIRAPFADSDTRSCFSLDEAREWVELEAT
jgi:hypothetical protein